MYRYSLDNTVAYSSDDIVLYKESPFASWMERLTLESPQHGIAADEGSGQTKVDSAAQHGFKSSRSGEIESVNWQKLVELRQAPVQTGTDELDGVVQSLSGSGKVVVVVDGTSDESQRRTQTLEAMKRGADLIINGQLASGPLSDTAKLLMRRSGFSEFGNYLYIPCDTSPVTTPHSAFRLCFLADLLHNVQGQLPPQMLIIRGDSDMVSLQVEDHIYYYRAVKQRFMAEQGRFRKHRMPDPADSSHFGRWSQCARDVLKQRALSEGGAVAQSGQIEELETLPIEAPDPAEVAVNNLSASTAPPPTLRPKARAELTATPASSLTAQADQSFDLDLAIRPDYASNHSSLSSSSSFVDRDRAMFYSDAPSAELPITDRYKRPKEDESQSEYSKKKVRPISSVLITCPQGIY